MSHLHSCLCVFVSALFYFVLLLKKHREHCFLFLLSARVKSGAFHSFVLGICIQMVFGNSGLMKQNHWIIRLAIKCHESEGLQLSRNRKKMWRWLKSSTYAMPKNILTMMKYKTRTHNHNHPKQKRNKNHSIQSIPIYFCWFHTFSTQPKHTLLSNLYWSEAERREKKSHTWSKHNKHNCIFHLRPAMITKQCVTSIDVCL